MGRPTKLNDDVGNTIGVRVACQPDRGHGLRNGWDRAEDVAVVDGTGPGVWAPPGAAEAVQAARADCGASLAARITLAAQRGSWRAAAWLLEHEYPDRWGVAPRARS